MNPSESAPLPRVAVIGGGPAGLRAAEVLSTDAQCAVTVFEGQPSVGRKFLVAGKGGLNLTHSEPLPGFGARYRGGDWPGLLAVFGPEDLRAWAAGLEVETFVGSSGRVFPVGRQSARLLRRWVTRLRAAGVHFRVRHRLADIRQGGGICFGSGWEQFDAVVLGLGGASWPQTGSDGAWPPIFQRHGMQVTPWQPANCGWNVQWPDDFLGQFAGTPLKNLAVTAGGRMVRGEMVVTRHGLEGGPLYQLGPELRAMEHPAILIDFKPDNVGPVPKTRVSPAVAWLLEHGQGWETIHRHELRLTGPRPLEEAISSAGGIAWHEVDDSLQLRQMPGTWVCGEMLDWEAPTGGYLLQGCFTTGTVAALGVLDFLRKAAKPGQITSSGSSS